MVLVEEEFEGGEYEAEASSSPEEYSVEEEVAIEVKEFNPNDVEILIKRSELWDRLVRGEIGFDEAKKILAEVIPSISESLAGAQRRRRKKSSK